jgi:hypothetical protein
LFPPEGVNGGHGAAPHVVELFAFMGEPDLDHRRKVPVARTSISLAHDDRGERRVSLVGFFVADADQTLADMTTARFEIAVRQDASFPGRLDDPSVTSAWAVLRTRGRPPGSRGGRGDAPSRSSAAWATEPPSPRARLVSARTTSGFVSGCRLTRTSSQALTDAAKFGARSARSWSGLIQPAPNATIGLRSSIRSSGAARSSSASSRTNACLCPRSATAMCLPLIDGRRRSRCAIERPMPCPPARR